MWKILAVIGTVLLVGAAAFVCADWETSTPANPWTVVSPNPALPPLECVSVRTETGFWHLTGCQQDNRVLDMILKYPDVSLAYQVQ